MLAIIMSTTKYPYAKATCLMPWSLTKNLMLSFQASLTAWNEGTQGNWKLQERFFLDVGKHLNPNGHIYFLTGLLDNLLRTRKLIEENGLKIMRTHMAYDIHQNLEPIVYVIQHTPAAPMNDTTAN